MQSDEKRWTVVDLFSGCGGMSLGFARRQEFRMIAAVDAEQAKPCEGFGKLDCNVNYESNIGIRPIEADIAKLDPQEFFDKVAASVSTPLRRGELTVLLCCPPCTDFSRAKPVNHLMDLPKNTLVQKSADFVEAFLPEFVLMENARELIQGNHSHHYFAFKARLESLGYEVKEGVHLLTKYGLPQIRERALVVASRIAPVNTLDDLWKGHVLSEKANTVRHAIGHLAAPVVKAGEVNEEDPMHRCPGFASEQSRKRMEAIPADGGSWFDLAKDTKTKDLLTESMRKKIAQGKLGSHPDVYGRLAWNQPCVTIKRECAHVGNGRYAHPEQARLLTVREMSLLQGFPGDFKFSSGALANNYRHIGDAVPPLISYQLSALVKWMKTGSKPAPEEWVLPGSSLKPEDVKTAADFVLEEG